VTVSTGSRGFCKVSSISATTLNPRSPKASASPSCGSSKAAPKETHFVNFAQERIADYVKANFEITQLNITGSLKVVDFGGSELREKDLAAKYGVRYTPTFQFFGENAATMKTLPAPQREVSRTQGYLRPDDFLASFRFVRDRAYEKGSFRDFLKAQPS
jgi:thioredoxin-related protein